MRTFKVEKVGPYSCEFNAPHLVFLVDPDCQGPTKSGASHASISIWYDEHTLALRRVHRGGKGITRKLRASERRAWDTALGIVLAYAQLAGVATPFEIDLPL